ncbi:hypothetical protein HK097_003826, partial [Rhizophlyctis rosea]
MARAVKVAPRTEPSKQPSQTSHTEKATANVTVTGSGKPKETWSERRKRQKEERKAGASANPGDGKSAAPGSSNGGNKGGGGGGKGSSSGGGSGGKRNGGRTFDPCPFCGRADCNPRFCTEAKRAVEEMKKRQANLTEALQVSATPGKRLARICIDSG